MLSKHPIYVQHKNIYLFVFYILILYYKNGKHFFSILLDFYPFVVFLSC